MSIISSPFFIFLFTTILLYYTLPEKFQSGVLLGASLFFYYLSGPIYTVLIVIMVYADFIISRKINNSGSSGNKKYLLLCGLSLNLAVLLVFKFIGPLEKLLARFIPSLNLWEMKYFVKIAVPIGLSYFIFKKISYLVDVYRGTISNEKKYSRLLLYVIFFPEIVAGPIDRAGDLLSQFGRKITPAPYMFLSGFQRVLWGIFKKVVIADRVSIFVDIIFKSYNKYDGTTVLAGIILYSIQIYCDFSAIADIAIGMGKMFGITLNENFNRPYFATSVSDFWRRWHITLSTWLRDYIFLPIAYFFSAKFKKEKILLIKSENLLYVISAMTTMVICGFWHGSGWTFILWGAIHGSFLIFSHLTRKLRRKVKRKIGLTKIHKLNIAIKTTITFSLVTFSWIFFRAKSPYHAFEIVKKIFYGSDKIVKTFTDLNNLVLKDFPPFTIEIILISISLLLIVEIIQKKLLIGRWILDRSLLFKLVIYYFTIFLILIFTVKKSGDFIYMQF